MTKMTFTEANQMIDEYIARVTKAKEQAINDAKEIIAKLDACNLSDDEKLTLGLKALVSIQ